MSGCSVVFSKNNYHQQAAGHLFLLGIGGMLAAAWSLVQILSAIFKQEFCQSYLGIVFTFFINQFSYILNLPLLY